MSLALEGEETVLNYACLHLTRFYALIFSSFQRAKFGLYQCTKRKGEGHYGATSMVLNFFKKSTQEEQEPIAFTGKLPIF